MKKYFLLFLVPLLSQCSQRFDEAFIVEIKEQTIVIFKKDNPSLQRVAAHRKPVSSSPCFIVYTTVNKETGKEFPANPVSFHNDLLSAVPFSTKKTALDSLGITYNRTYHRGHYEK